MDNKKITELRIQIHTVLFYNIHTHHASAEPDEWCLINVFKEFDKIDSATPCSVGLHPWHLQADTLQEEVSQLRAVAKRDNVYAIGECGLDRVCDTDWELQQKAFQIQMGLSNELRKPLIVHSVRAHQEVLQMLRKYHHQQPVIFHGVNHKAISQLWQAGHFVSFGSALLQPKSEAVKAFREVAADSYFLETDDAPITIQQVYEAAASIKQVSVSQIIQQVEQNFRSIFAT